MNNIEKELIMNFDHIFAEHFMIILLQNQFTYLQFGELAEMTITMADRLFIKQY